MKNNKKKSFLLLFIIIFIVNGCSDGLFNNLGQNGGTNRPSTGNPDIIGDGTTSRPTPSTPENPDGGGGTTSPTPDNPDIGGGTTPPTPDNPDIGGGATGDVEMNVGDYIGGSGSGGPFPSCDPSTAKRPIKRLIAGASDRKIYYSDDNGRTWTRSTMPAGLPDTHTWQAFEDLGNDIVLAGSGGNAVSGAIDFGGGLGIMKSTDGGKSWRRTRIINEPNPRGLKIRDFLHVGKGIVIVATDIVDGGIWRSTDYGESWVQNVHKNPADFGRTPETADGIQMGITSGLALLPDGRILVTRSQQVTNGTGGSVNNPIYYSEDKGLTWYCPVNLNHTDLVARGSGETIVLQNGTVVMAGQANGSIPYSFGKLEHWGWPEVTLSAFGTKRNVGFESITELRNGTVIAGGYSVYNPNRDEIQIPGIWRSTTNGRSYEQVFDSFGWRSVVGLDNCDIIGACMTVGFDGYVDSTKAVCNGLYKSTNNGTTWSKMSGLNGLEITSIIAVRQTQ